MRRFFPRLLLVGLLSGLAGCSSMMSSSISGLADSLSSGILNQNDPQVVADGAPAYLLLMDGLIGDDPKNPALLSAGAKLYGAYSSVFVTDPKRVLIMTDKAFDYATRAMCARIKPLCIARDKPFDEYQKALTKVSKEKVGVLYQYTVAQAGWIQARTSDWNALAALPKVKAGFARVLALDPSHEGGAAQLYMGVIESLLPPAMGGKPDVARAHFEEAIRLSDGKNLMAKVLFAERYARLVFDKKLHDQLLNEVLAAKPEAPDLTLSNILAKDKAQKLLKSGKEYF